VTDEPLMTFKSHIDGKNAEVAIYANRIEYEVKRALTKRTRESEVIPIKAISSVTQKRDGVLWHKVSVICSGNTVDFRCDQALAKSAKKLLTDLILGNPVEPVVTAQPRSAQRDDRDEQQSIDRPPPRRSKPLGWYRDPGGKFDYRYFDGEWTDDVSNEGDDKTYIDPVPR